MVEKLNNIVKFRGDRLFNGAVNVSWVNSDPPKAKLASESFVFHGPKYHGIRQEDVGVTHGHKLIDTASFALKIANRCFGHEENPFTLAIAGYGTGKSHLALTLATLFGDPCSETAQTIMEALRIADSGIAGELALVLKETSQPCLAITINGMQGVDLSAEISKQIAATLQKDGHDTRPLADLRPRFTQAAKLAKLCNDSMKEALLAAIGLKSLDEVITFLDNQNEDVYAKVHDFFAANGLPISSLRGESVKEVLETAVNAYCGSEKPYRALLILFDEFGKYTEFATVKSQIAGNGVIQDLFEAVQSNSGKVCFVGFIQFELNAYMQRVAPELRNEIQRYITRFQNVSKLYLSINLETLISSLLEKSQPDRLQNSLRDVRAIEATQETLKNIGSWFPHSRNYRVWSDCDLYYRVVREGCWPLSPYATWFLFYLASAGKHLQERSALAILGEAIQRFEEKAISEIADWTISPTDLWSDLLHQEFITSEEGGQQGSIAHAYSSVLARHGARFSPAQISILRAIVLAAKLGLVVSEKSKAVYALGELAGLSFEQAQVEIKQLQEEYNIIEWDDSFKSFDILGDAIPRTQFISFLRQRVNSSFDEAGKAKLFITKAQEWFSEVLCNRDSDFAEENNIGTQEWRFCGVRSNSLVLPQNIKIAVDSWLDSFEVDKPRGSLIYTYLGPTESLVDNVKAAGAHIRKIAGEVGYSEVPVIVLFLNDENGDLGRSMAEYAVLESLNETDKKKFGNLVEAHKEKLIASMNEQINSMIKDSVRITGLKNDPENRRLGQLCTEVFRQIYKSPIMFPFDGFNTAKGNAADTCYELTRELLLGKLDYNGVMTKGPKVKNRAIRVLNDTWKIFNKNASVSRRPEYPILSTLTANWDDQLNKDGKIHLYEAVKHLCLPPYGANIASAGLFLGAYFAPRIESIAVVKGTTEIAISNWIQEDLFKSKFLSLPALQSAYVIKQGETSSEWELLLDEWEHCTSHKARLECFSRSQKLKTRIPLPKTQAYREEAFIKQAHESHFAIKAFEKEYDDALRKIELGKERKDLAILAHGVYRLKQLVESMVKEDLWLESEIQELRPHIETGRQLIIQFFPEWLPQQTPRSDAPDEVGNFKHQMIHLIGKNIKGLGLEDEYSKIDAHTSAAVKNVEVISEARQLIQQVDNWLLQNSNVVRLPKVAQMRNLLQTGKSYSAKLNGLSKRVQMPAINERRSRVLEFAKQLRDSEDAFVNRSSSVWDSAIKSENDIDTVFQEIDCLINAFEGLEEDLEDLQTMKKMLRLYRSFNQRLENDGVTWDAFETMAEECRQQGKSILGDDEVPWSPDEIVDVFVKTHTKSRKEKSSAWLSQIEQEVAQVESMGANEANKLLNRLGSPPAFITEVHLKTTKKLVQQVTNKLNTLELEWLVEKFKELPTKSQKEFLATAKKLISS